MEYYFFIIIVIIVLKILFWTFYFYVRAQRRQQLQNGRGVIIVQRQVVRRPRPYNDQSAIINHAEPVSVTGPPPYSQVVKDGNTPQPPPYSQVVASHAPAAAYPGAASDASAPSTAYSGPVSSSAGGYPHQFAGNASQAQSFSPPLHAVPSNGPPGPMQSQPSTQTPSAPVL